MNDERRGLAEVAGSAALFGTVGLLAKLAHDEHLSLTALLTGRFLIASAALWIAVIAFRRALPTWRVALAGLALGATGFSVSSALNFAAIERMGAGMAALVGYSYPVLVTAGAVALGRERLSLRAVCALGIALGGIALLVAGQGLGAIDSTGAMFALASALVYTAYVLIASSLGDKVEALPFAALVATGAGAAFAVADLVRGPAGVSSTGGIVLILVFALVPTAFGFFAFLRGISRIGAPRASIIGALEPAVAVLLGVFVLGETLRSLQLVGGALVIGAIVLLELRRERGGAQTPRAA